MADQTKPKPLTKAQIKSNLAERSGLTAKQVEAVLDAQAALAVEQLKGGVPYTVADLVKLSTRVKKATPAGEKKNPFTGLMVQVAAKPESKAVKAAVLKPVKDAVAG